jgi:hypothetical protein
MREILCSQKRFMRYHSSLFAAAGNRTLLDRNRKDNRETASSLKFAYIALESARVLIGERHRPGISFQPKDLEIGSRIGTALIKTAEMFSSEPDGLCDPFCQHFSWSMA